MIFIKLIEILFYLLTYPLQLFQGIIPSIPQTVTNLINEFLEMLQTGFTFVVAILTCGGDKLCTTLLGLSLALFLFRYNYKWILGLFHKLVGFFSKN